MLNVSLEYVNYAIVLFAVNARAFIVHNIFYSFPFLIL